MEPRSFRHVGKRDNLLTCHRPNNQGKDIANNQAQQNWNNTNDFLTVDVKENNTEEGYHPDSKVGNVVNLLVSNGLIHHIANGCTR